MPEIFIMKRNLQSAFNRYDEANPKVWDAFTRFAKDAKLTHERTFFTSHGKDETV